MTRLCLALITALYAISFAFLAIMAVRWPSVLALAALFSESTGLNSDIGVMIDWRQLGLFYGGLYLFAAISFYACSTLLQRRKRGALTAFITGTLAGFPFLALFDFAENWWRSPDLFEQITIGAAIFALFLMPAISAASPQARRKRQNHLAAMPAAPLAAQQNPAMILVPQTSQRPTPKPRRRKPVPAAIARQRESFAAHGRRALARRQR